MKNLASFLLSVMLICFSACSNNDDLVEVRQQVTPLKNLVRSTTFNYQGKNYTSEFNYTNDSFFYENKLPFGEDKIIRFICVVLMRWNFLKIVYV